MNVRALAVTVDRQRTSTIIGQPLESGLDAWIGDLKARRIKDYCCGHQGRFALALKILIDRER